VSAPCRAHQTEKATLISECGLYLMLTTTYSPTLVWGGHSCPPPLTLGLLWTFSDAKDKFEVKIKVKVKINVKGSGQECPLHTTPHHTNRPN
jgi:hypothetical protein